jgi:molybdate transport system substrate-binding protein
MRRRDWIKIAASASSGILAAVAGPAFAQSPPGTGKKALVGAASDLRFALADVIAQFERETPHRFTLNLGSSGNFAQQIRQGLPVELYLSADEAYVFQLADAGLTQDRGSLYAIGRIALLVPAGSTIALDAELRGLKAQWASVTRFAIANPVHAPYGRAAAEALQKLGVWEQVQSGLVLGENISQATQFVTTGAAQAGITALSLAVAPDVAAQSRHVVLPARLHAPLRQRMVLTKQAGPAARALYDHLRSPGAQATLQKYGFAAD